MIVDTMTFKEVADAIVKAKVSSLKRMFALMDSKKKEYMRIINNWGDKRCDFKYFFIEKNDIQLYLCPYSRIKRDCKKNGLCFFLFAKVYYKHNIYWCMVTMANKVSFFKNHLFERYLERHCEMSEGSEVTPEVVQNFFRETDTLFTGKTYSTEQHPNGVLAGTSIGTCCGDMVDEIVIYKTFIDATTVNYYKKRIYDTHPKDLRERLDSLSLIKNLYLCA